MENDKDLFLWKYININDSELDGIKQEYLKKLPSVDNFYTPMSINYQSFLGFEIINAVLIYAMPKKSYMIHIDYRTDKQKLALNIPLINCENSVTEFWECSKRGGSVNPKDSWRSPQNFLPNFNFDKENCKKIDQYILDKPILFNTQVPHSVTNFSDKPRLAISLRFKNDPWELVGL